MRPEGGGASVDPILPAEALPRPLEGLTVGDERISIEVSRE
jgi:hypothetical protein